MVGPSMAHGGGDGGVKPADAGDVAKTLLNLQGDNSGAAGTGGGGNMGGGRGAKRRPKIKSRKKRR